jgi:hypothetical protein
MRKQRHQIPKSDRTGLQSAFLAKTIFRRYFGPDEGDWDPRFNYEATGEEAALTMVRFTPETVVVRDQSYKPTRRLLLPTQIDLPFFAYGIFQPGQLGYHRLRELVRDARSACRIKGSLRIRDGLPLIDPGGEGKVPGTILVFKPDARLEAYKRIGDIEPD